MTESARNKIVEENMGLVHSIARRFLGRGCDFEELRQIGAIGLIKAVDRFDPSFGGKLSTYAVPVIMGEIKRFLRDDGPVKVSRSLKELAVSAMAEKEKLEAELGREVTVGEIARSLGQEEENIAAALASSAAPRSIYEETDKEIGMLLLDSIAGEADAGSSVINKIAVAEALKKLDNRERNVIIMRFFRCMSQEAVAREIGVSQVQISRIEARAKEKLRKLTE